MAKQTFTTGQVLTAAQMTSLQQTAMLGGAASAKTASYTLVAADAGTAISMSSASATTITVNTALFAAGDTVQITNLGVGVCTITAGTATVNTSASLALAQYESGTLDFTSTSAAIFIKGAAAATSSNITWTQLANATSLTGSSTSITGLSGYNYLHIMFNGVQSNTASANFTLRINSDTSSNYRNFLATLVGLSTYSPTIIQDEANTAATSIILATQGGTGNEGSASGFLQLQGSNSTSNKMYFFGLGASRANVANDHKARYGGGFIVSTAVVSSVQVLCSAGNFSSGSVTIYGGN